MRALSAWLAASIAASALLGCEQPRPEDRHLRLKLLRGEADPLWDPGSATVPAAPVGSLELTWSAAGEKTSETVALTGARDFSVRVDPPEADEAVLLVRGLRSTGGAYSGARSLPVPLAAGTPDEVTAFFGPLDAFTAVGPELTSPRLGIAAAALGQTGALLVGGYEVRDGAERAVSPSLLSYRMSEARACGPGPSEGCLSGALPAPRRDAIAVTLSSGSVLHGLGRLDDGTPDRALYLTSPEGVTEQLALTGELPALYGAAAVALPDGAVLLIGGHDGAAPRSTVFLLDVRNKQVLAQPGLQEARAFAAAIRLTFGEILVAGGEGLGGPLQSAESYALGQGSVELEGGDFPQARARLRGPRVAPSAVRLIDDAVLLWGGGTAGGEVYHPGLGRYGAFVDVKPPPASEEAAFDTPALVRLRSGEVLLVGGERPSTLGARALLFRPDKDQQLSAVSYVYAGEYEPVGAPLTLRGRPAAVELADGTVLLAGGGTHGQTPAGADNPPATRVELMVTLRE